MLVMINVGLVVWYVFGTNVTLNSTGNVPRLG